MGERSSSTDDVFGLALLNWARGGTTPEILERDDGFAQQGAGPEVYLSSFRDWSPAERRTVRHLRGRVLDVGCGAGRLSLELQRRGFDVVGLDASPLAAKAAGIRGVAAVVCTPLQELAALDSFDSMVFFGNNLGIFGTPRHARASLSDLARRAKPSSRIFMESTNPYSGGAPGFDRHYYRKNKERDVAPGQVRLRFHFEDLTGPWFDWFYASRRDLLALVRGTGWRHVRTIGSLPSEPYVAIFERE